MSSGTNSERITQNVDDINKSTEKIKNLKIATFQDKTITENGTYQADDDYTGLGKVIVDVPSSGTDTSDATATSDDILEDKVAYNAEGKVIGTMANYGAGLNTNIDSITPDTGYDGTYIEFKSQELSGPFGFPDKVVTLYMSPKMSQVAEGIGLTADKIVKGNTILGIEGTYEGGSSDEELNQIAKEILGEEDDD